MKNVSVLRIAESIARMLEQDKDNRKIIADEYINHINRLANERDALLREIERLTDIVQCLQQIVSSSIKPNTNINIK